MQDSKYIEYYVVADALFLKINQEMAKFQQVICKKAQDTHPLKAH